MGSRRRRPARRLGFSLDVLSVAEGIGRSEGGAGQTAEGCWGKDLVHRARQSVGERILRELQWEAEGGMFEWGDLLLVEGGTDRDRAVAAAVQPGQTARRAGV